MFLEHSIIKLKTKRGMVNFLFKPSDFLIKFLINPGLPQPSFEQPGPDLFFAEIVQKGYLF